MSTEAAPGDDRSDIVVLNFEISFHKTESVLAPDGSPHQIMARCLQQHYHKILQLHPFKAKGDPNLVAEERLAYLRTSSDHRALLSVALAFYDAQFARTAAEPVRARILPPPPPDPG